MAIPRYPPDDLQDLNGWTTLYRLIGDNHALDGLPFAAQVFLRSLERVRRNLASEVGVPGAELRALARVAEDARAPYAELAEHLELSQAAVDDVVRSLVAKGLLQAPNGVSAGTQTELRLTDAGHALMERVYLAFQNSITTAAESLDEERLNAFDSALLKMARKLDAAADSPASR